MIMAQLAIRGHATRGSEVIEVLEILGGIMEYYNDNNEPHTCEDYSWQVWGNN